MACYTTTHALLRSLAILLSFCVLVTALSYNRECVLSISRQEVIARQTAIFVHAEFKLSGSGCHHEPVLVDLYEVGAYRVPTMSIWIRHRPMVLNLPALYFDPAVSNLLVKARLRSGEAVTVRDESLTIREAEQISRKGNKTHSILEASEMTWWIDQHNKPPAISTTDTFQIPFVINGTSVTFHATVPLREVLPDDESMQDFLISNGLEDAKVTKWFQTEVQKHIVMSRHQRQRIRSQIQTRSYSNLPVKLIVGAASDKLQGWIATDMNTLELSNRSHFNYYWGTSSPNRLKLDAVLAEHVFEHLTPLNAVMAILNLRRSVSKNGYIRIAVPDFWGSPASTNEALLFDEQDGHEMQLNIDTLSHLLIAFGFRVSMLEFTDNYGSFHSAHWDDEKGTVKRSRKFDPRGGISVIVDAIMIAPQLAVERHVLPQSISVLKLSDMLDEWELRFSRAVKSVVPESYSRDWQLSHALKALVQSHRLKRAFVYQQLVQDPSDLCAHVLNYISNSRVTSMLDSVSQLQLVVSRLGELSELDERNRRCTALLWKFVSTLKSMTFHGMLESEVPILEQQSLVDSPMKSYGIFSDIVSTVSNSIHAREYCLASNLSSTHEHLNCWMTTPKAPDIETEAFVSSINTRNSNVQVTVNWKLITEQSVGDIVFCITVEQTGHVSCLDAFELEENRYGTLTVPFASGVIRFQSFARNSLHQLLSEKVVDLQSVLKDSMAYRQQRKKRNVHHSRNTKSMCFYTMVLNGMPFMLHHMEQFQALESQFGIKWSWHIAEGLANGRADRSNPYSKETIADTMYSESCNSVDGTTQYINELSSSMPDRVFVHRVNGRCGWQDKIEMANAALKSIHQPCLLVQLDVDELWHAFQLARAYDLMVHNNPQGYTCAYFDCHFFITPQLLTATRGGYSHNDKMEWQRMWLFEPGMFWISHAPPRLVFRDTSTGTWQAVGHRPDGMVSNCYTQNETASHGLVFTHYAYVMEKQVAFKEEFYGYKNALDQWKKLNVFVDTCHVPSSSCHFPVHLHDHLDFVPPGTYAVLANQRNKESEIETFDSRIGADVAIIRMPSIAKWKQLKLASNKTKQQLQQHIGRNSVISKDASNNNVLVLDGVVFQLYAKRKGGIRRVWEHIIPLLVQKLVKHSNWKVILLDRGGTVLRDQNSKVWLENAMSYGMELHSIPPYQGWMYKSSIKEVDDEVLHQTHIGNILDFDDEMLSSIVRNFNATVFASTLYTRLDPSTRQTNSMLNIRQLLLVHDMIPEDLAWDPRGVDPEWISKIRALDTATQALGVSSHTVDRLIQYWPKFSHIGCTFQMTPSVDDSFCANVPSALRVEQFRKQHQLGNDHIILHVGSRSGYKGGLILPQLLLAMASTPLGFDILTSSKLQDPIAPVVDGQATSIRLKLTFLFVGERVDMNKLPAFERRIWDMLADIGVKAQFIHSVSDDELQLAYHSAFLLSYLSHSEGFGIPILESLKCGTPVMLLDTNTASLQLMSDYEKLLDNDSKDSCTDPSELIESFVLDSNFLPTTQLNALKFLAHLVEVHKAQQECVSLSAKRFLANHTWNDAATSFANIITNKEHDRFCHLAQDGFNNALPRPTDTGGVVVLPTCGNDGSSC